MNHGNGGEDDGDDDDALWAWVTRHVKHLPGREISAGVKPAVRKRIPRPPEPAAAEGKKAAVSPAGRELDRRTRRRFERGEMVIDARLDLHGLNQDTAYQSLLTFVTEQYGRKARLLLVITGKGAASGGVLKTNVPRWLEEPPLRDKILALAPAQPRHGGGGALYVLLRRQRDEAT